MGLALLTGSQVLLGYPQYVWFSLLAEASYAAWVLWELQTGDRRRGADCQSAAFPARLAPRLSRLAISLALGLLMGTVEWLPTLDALGHSARHAADAAFADSGSLDPLNLVQLVAPYLFRTRVVGDNTHELGLYCGAVPLVLVAWLMSQWRRLGRLRKSVLAAAVFGLLALLLAFGEYGPLYRFQSWLPIVGRFRFPCRYIALFQFSIAVIAAAAFALLARQHERAIDGGPKGWSPGFSRSEKGKPPEGGTPTDRKMSRSPAACERLWHVPLVFVLVASVAAAVAGLALLGRQCIASPWAILAGPAMFALAFGLIAAAARGVRGALIALVLFTVTELTFYGITYSVFGGTEPLEQYVARAETPPGNPGPRVLCDLLRLDQPGLRTGNQMLMAGWRAPTDMPDFSRSGGSTITRWRPCGWPA